MNSLQLEVKYKPFISDILARVWFAVPLLGWPCRAKRSTKKAKVVSVHSDKKINQYEVRMLPMQIPIELQDATLNSYYSNHNHT